MIATTIINSIRVKPEDFFILLSPVGFNALLQTPFLPSPPLGGADRFLVNMAPTGIGLHGGIF
jgi:hypothetical protein